MFTTKKISLYRYIIQMSMNSYIHHPNSPPVIKRHINRKYYVNHFTFSEEDIEDYNNMVIRKKEQERKLEREKECERMLKEEKERRQMNYYIYLALMPVTH